MSRSAKDFSVYRRHPLRAETILGRLRRERGGIDEAAEPHFAVDETTEITDQNHVGGSEFLRELAEKVGVDSATRVLDVGSGLGGPARLLAHWYGCRVVGVEITPFRHGDAVELTRLVGLGDRVHLLCADFMTAELPREGFDLIISQSSFFHFRDRAAAVARCAGLLVGNGSLVLEDSCLRRQPRGADDERDLADLGRIWRGSPDPFADWCDLFPKASLAFVSGENLDARARCYFQRLIDAARRLPPEQCPDEEIRGWTLAVDLIDRGLIGYFRLIGSKSCPHAGGPDL
ncbi:MAG: class I SAM-dependent methyltransferase [bacterium]|nr:class I SAM-dependent methyltransferase [bacterium]